MAFELKYSLCEQCDCKEALFNDTSGVYNVSTNPTGYGTPNVESTAITSATIVVTPPSYETPITFTFTISSGTVTAATRTDTFGVVVDVLSLLNTTVFPFVDLTFDSILLFGDSEQSDLEDGAWLMVYTVSDGTDTYQLNAYNFFICSATRCRDNTAIGFIKKTVSKSDAITVFVNYDVLLASVGLKDVSAVNSQIEAMQSICNPCSNC